MLNRAQFEDAFSVFTTLYPKHNHGHPFTNFSEGLAHGWEEYKPRLREHARRLLGVDGWQEEQIGSGHILDRVIAAIEVQAPDKGLINNLVFWQNRYGPASREHRALIDAQTDARSRHDLERLLFALYRDQDDEGVIFDKLANATGRKYPLIAYLYFLKDSDRFVPIHPTGYDRAFREVGVDLITLGQCSWSNYSQYNAALQQIRAALQQVTGLANLRLIDAHSFCWILNILQDAEQDEDGARRIDRGRRAEAREQSILEMKYGIINTAQQARGQTVDRTVQMKLKNLGFDPYELEQHLRELMDKQRDCCALTGIRFQFKSEGVDQNMLPSPDRIDSNGHYERGNIQIVCRFINLWKGSMPNEEFARLLSLVRSPVARPLGQDL